MTAMLELYGIKLKIPERVYEPDEDTFLLISALQNSGLAGKTCLEIGCGSGIITLFLAKRAKSVVAADINPEAVASAKENAALNSIKNAKFIKSDLFSNVTGTFDLIAFNPPYLPDEPESRDIALDGGKDGRKIINRFLRSVPKFLNENGVLFILESSLSQYPKTIRHLKNAGFDAQIVAEKKLGWEVLVVIRAIRQ